MATPGISTLSRRTTCALLTPYDWHCVQHTQVCKQSIPWLIADTKQGGIAQDGLHTKWSDDRFFCMIIRFSLNLVFWNARNIGSMDHDELMSNYVVSAATLHTSPWETMFRKQFFLIEPTLSPTATCVHYMTRRRELGGKPTFACRTCVNQAIRLFASLFGRGTRNLH